MPRVLYTQYTNPAGYPPLEHSSQILADAGWQVMFLGTGALGSNSLRFPPHPNISVKRLRFWPPGFIQKVHYLVYCVWILAWMIAWRPDWIYASDLLSCPVALALSFVPGLRVIYHEHDSPAPWPTTTSGKVALWMRRQMARRVFCSVLPNEARAEHFKADTATTRPVLRVWNCPRKSEISHPRSPVATEDTWLLYHGSIVPDRLPLSVLIAMANLPDCVKLRIIGYETVGSRGYVTTIRDSARHLGISHRLEILGPMPRFELLGYCQRSDIGLALMPMITDDANMLAMSGASNKVFDYMARGLAVVVSDLGDWRNLYVAPGYGVACNPNDAASVEEALRSLIAEPPRFRAMGEKGRQRVDQEWNYEAQFEKVLECIEQLSGYRTRAYVRVS
jgi:glycosyltransferase involved in cell wall biosynthesis